jgi:hypothetical protein
MKQIYNHLRARRHLLKPLSTLNLRRLAINEFDALNQWAGS